MTVRKKPAPQPAAVAPAELPTLSFRATLSRGDSAMGAWRWIDIPERVSRALAPWAKAGHVRIDATLDGVAVQGSLSPRGGGRHMMILNAALRREAGLADGRAAAIAVTVTPRVTDAVRVPDDLAAALAKDGARDAFEALSSSHRWELVRYVLGAGTDATRARYVARAVDHALGREPAVAASATRSAPRGWHCPECGKHFSKALAEHPCERLPLDLPFAGKSAAVRALFDALRAKVEALAAVTLAVHKEGVSFVGRRRFLWVVPRAKWLELRLVMARRVEAPGVRAFTHGPGQHTNTLRVRSAEELDEVTALLREAVAHGGPAGAEPAEAAPSRGGASTGWERDVDDSFFAGLDAM
jgi:hypothetical protein